MVIKKILCFLVVATGISAAPNKLSENSNILQESKEVMFENITENITVIQTSDPYQFRYVPFSKKGCLNFAVKAGNEAHISLSNSAQYINPKIKIVIGGWNNAASAIVINDNINSPQVKTFTPQILNKDLYRAFWIQWSQDGDILVGNYSKNLPLMIYKHSEQLFPINFIGVTCGPSNKGSWIILEKPQFCPIKFPINAAN